MAEAELQRRIDLVERIGAGGMGEVFLATSSGAHGFEKTVAVKRILPELAREEAFVSRFVIEAKVAVSLSHANLVQVFDLGREREGLYLVMEHVDGPDLGRLIRALSEQNAPMPVEIALHIATETLRGLAYAHERVDPDGHPRGVIHCDISPSNLLVSYAGEVKIADFGVAQMLSARRTGLRRPTPGRVGKYPYMAPEIMRGDPVDARTDLYALAVVFYEMLAGRRLFEGPATEALVETVLAGKTPRLRDSRGDVPMELDEILAQTVSVDPERRPPNARAMLAELARVAYAIGPTLTAPDVGSWARAWIPAPRRATRLSFDGALEGLVGAPRGGTITKRASDAVEHVRPRIASFLTRSEAGSVMTVWQRVPAPSQRSTVRRRTWTLAITALAGCVVAALALLRWNDAARNRSSTPAVTALAAPAASKPQAPAEVRPMPSDSSGESVDRVVPLGLDQRKVARAPSRGFVNIYAEPWAHVVVDGKPVGTTPLMKLPLAAGTHRIRLESPGRRAVQRTVNVSPRQTQLLNVDMAAMANGSIAHQ